MNLSLQDRPCSNQMTDSRFPTAVISHFYSAVYVDRGYPRAQEMYEDMGVVAAIRRKPGKKLSDAEKTFNRLIVKR